MTHGCGAQCSTELEAAKRKDVACIGITRAFSTSTTSSASRKVTEYGTAWLYVRTVTARRTLHLMLTT